MLCYANQPNLDWTMVAKKNNCNLWKTCLITVIAIVFAALNMIIWFNIAHMKQKWNRSCQYGLIFSLKHLDVLDALSDVDDMAMLVLSAMQIANATRTDEIMWYAMWCCPVSLWSLREDEWRSYACEDWFTEVRHKGSFTDILHGTMKLILM